MLCSACVALKVYCVCVCCGCVDECRDGTRLPIDIVYHRLIQSFKRNHFSYDSTVDTLSSSSFLFLPSFFNCCFPFLEHLFVSFLSRALVVCMRESCSVKEWFRRKSSCVWVCGMHIFNTIITLSFKRIWILNKGVVIQSSFHIYLSLKDVGLSRFSCRLKAPIPIKKIRLLVTWIHNNFITIDELKVKLVWFSPCSNHTAHLHTFEYGLTAYKIWTEKKDEIKICKFYTKRI